MAVTMAGDTCSLGVTLGPSSLVARPPHFLHSLTDTLLPVLPLPGCVILDKSLPLSES